MLHLVYNASHSVVPINYLLLAITLYSSVITTQFHNVITMFELLLSEVVMKCYEIFTCLTFKCYEENVEGVTFWLTLISAPLWRGWKWKGSTDLYFPLIGHWNSDLVLSCPNKTRQK